MEIDTEIEKLFNKKFVIKYYEKPNKVENGNMNFSLYEIMIQGKSLDGKIKTDKTIAYPDILNIIYSEDKIILDLNEKNSQITIVIDEPLYVIRCIFIAFKLFFPCEDVFSFIPIKNDSALSIDSVKQELKDLDVRVQSPCNNFTFGVKFYAKYKFIPENEEIIWDIDIVYANKETNMFTLKDFDHLKPKYLFPVLGAMCYNTFFTELSLSFVDLSPYEKLLERVLKSNKKFKKLYFDSCNLKLPLCSSIVNGLEGQRNLKLLDFSNNECIGDKGVEIFIPFLKKSSRNLEVFKMSKCNLTSISISKIADAFTHNIKGNDDSFIELRVLDLSNNLLRDNFKDIFFDFLGKCSRLEELNLANMNSSINMIANYLTKGPVRTLKYIDLSENLSSLSPESCTQWSTFFTNAQSLISIKFSNFKFLHGSITQGLMLGLQSNSTLSLSGVEVILSNNNFNSDEFLPFCDFIYKAKSVSHLDISSNGIGTEFINLLNKLPEFPSLKSLNISNNFNGLKPKEQQNILSQMTAILQVESVTLQELYMSNCNFGSYLSGFISELDTYFSLRILDISGNNIGDIVARTIGRMLTVDKHIKEIILDNNNISKEIYEEILDGLAGNFTLATFHVPFMDLVKYPPKMVLTIIDKINRHHKKVNETYQGVSFEDIKSMAFSSMMNQTAENIDKCKATLQESCNRLKSINPSDDNLKKEIANCLKLALDNMKSIEVSKDLVVKLNSIYKNNDDTELLTDLRIKKVLEKVSSDVLILLNEYMDEVVGEMMNEIGLLLPRAVSNNESLRQELNDTCRQVMQFPQDYLKKLFSRFIEKNLLKKAYDTQSNVANAITDLITDSIINQMNVCDVVANRLIHSSKKTPESPTINHPDKESDSQTIDRPLIRNVYDKKSERDKMISVRTSRFSHMATSKARPLSKALKPIESIEATDYELPPKPMKRTKEKPVSAKQTNINNEETSSTEESIVKPITIKPISPIPKVPKRTKPVADARNIESSNQDSSMTNSPVSTTNQRYNIISKDSRTNPSRSNDCCSPDLTAKSSTSLRYNENQSINRIDNDESSSPDSKKDSIDGANSLKNRQKPRKKVKPKSVTPPIITTDDVIVFIDDDTAAKAATKKNRYMDQKSTRSDRGNEDISLSDVDENQDYESLKEKYSSDISSEEKSTK